MARVNLGLSKFGNLFLVLLLTALVVGSGDTETQSVGKVRSSAEMAFSKGDIDGSLKLWGQVIAMEPTNDGNFFKRFRVYLRQSKYKEAMSDLNSALNIKPTNEAALTQKGKLELRLGRCSEAYTSFTKLQSINPSNKDLGLLRDADECNRAIQESEHHYSHNNWHASRDLITSALRYSELSASLLMKRAYCNYYVGDLYECIGDAAKVLKIEKDSIEALELRGNAYYVLGELEMAVNHYRQGLKFDPEHAGCKNGHRLVKKITDFDKKAKKAMATGDFSNAVKYLKSLKGVDPQHNTIVPQANLDLANAHKQLKEFAEAKAAAQVVIEQNDNNGPAHRIMGQIHMEQDEFEEAVFQFKRAFELMEGDAGVQDEVQRAEAALKQSKMKDYYKTLGISRRATTKQIKKAYRDLALQWHPDKHKGEEEKEKAEKQFQAIAEAYEILSDDEKRAAYDRGEEVLPNQGGGQQGFNPFAQHFQHFQHGGGGGGGGHQQFHFNFG